MSIYVIIYNNGRAENVKEGYDFYDILTKYDYSGSTYPYKLMKDGKIVVDGGLDTMSWNYKSEYVKLNDERDKKLKQLFPEPNDDT